MVMHLMWTRSESTLKIGRGIHHPERMPTFGGKMKLAVYAQWK
jgi:hypothetical protein